MPRYKLVLEYDGSDFVGWQRQDNGVSIQGALEAAVLLLCGETVTIMGAGRTDAGVHALGQVAHLDLQRDFPPETVMQALNFHLRPAPISVLACSRAPEGFHARFSATKRSYLYRILNRLAPPALDRRRSWHVIPPLDPVAMQAAAQVLVGHHDFSSFRAVRCQAKSPVKTLDRLDVTWQGEEIHIVAEARSFLHNQVRCFAGSLKLVGEGKWSAGDLAAALAARDRTAAGPTAPAAGVYLTSVGYD